MSNAQGADSTDESAPRSVPGDSPALVLVRHGETEWSRSGQHTGRTDLPLTDEGVVQARAARPIIDAVLGGATKPFVISSPRQRALETARLTGFEPDEITELAAEWDYGALEGKTSAQIKAEIADWSIWTGVVPGGESAEEMTTRIDILLARVADIRTAEPDRPVLVFSHGHASRCIAARWLGEPVSAGAAYWLTTAAVSSLGYEHGRKVVLRWNIDSSISAAPTPTR